MIFVTDPPYTTYCGSLQRELPGMVIFPRLSNGYNTHSGATLTPNGVFLRWTATTSSPDFPIPATAAIDYGYFLHKGVDWFTAILKQ